jgi:hypothetical protein
VFAADAPVIQRRWRCPAAGYKPAVDPRDLDEGCQETIVAVERLTGVTGLCSCPLAELRAEVNPWLPDAMAAYHADERGDLLSRYAHPDAVLIDAIDLIRFGNIRRQDYERDHPPPRKRPPPVEPEE